MKRALLALLGLVTACENTADVADIPDASNDVQAAPVDAASMEASDAGSNDAADAGPNPCADAGVPASTLACTGLYSDFATKELAANALAYTPATPLWSDGAQKQRWIELPSNTQIDISNPDEWTFPVGTKVFKEFRVDGKRVETRMFQKTTTSFWVYATYAWNSDDSDAPINYGGPVPVGDPDSGVTWNIPTNDDCDECHRGRQDRILGFEQVGLGLPGAQGLTLAVLSQQGLLAPAPASVSLAIGDDGTGLDALALCWIHVNCGVTCHNSNPSAAGYGAGMLLRLDPTQLDGSPPDRSTWDILSTTINVPCVSGSLVGQPRIRPGNAAASVIHQLIDERGTLQMPPIASLVVDTSDVAVIGSWIGAMAVDGGAAQGAGLPEGGAPADSGSDASDRHLRDAGGVDGESAEAGPADATLAEGSDATMGNGGSTHSHDSGAIDAGSDEAATGDDAGAGEDASEAGQTDL